MNIKKRITAVLVILLLLSGSLMTASAASSGMSNFVKVNRYVNGKFIDVNSKDWFSSNVARAYEYNLMIGVSDDCFAPDKNLSLAEAVTVAARIHSCYNYGSYNFGSSIRWYESYAKYLYSKGIITNKGTFALSALTKTATRGNVAEILAHSLPESELSTINSIKLNQIPDVKSTASYADEVLLLYRAGILNGMDISMRFCPNSNIKRSELAAIISRLIDKSLRVKIKIFDNNQDLIYYYLTENMGLNKMVSCAIMGNIKQESGYSPIASGGSYYGLLQWGGERKQNLISFCNKFGYDYKTVIGQMEYFNYEMSIGYYKRFMDELRKMANSYDKLEYATEYFMEKIEGTRADLSNRIKYAKENWNRY